MTDLRMFEDIAPGETHEAGPILVTREAIIAFAQTYDPQPFHLDEAAGAASLLGGLAASGWQTAAFGMRLLFDGFVAHVASMGAPGVDELRWLKPVRPGDALHMIITTGATRPSASRPDRGLVAVAMDLRNGAAETVMTQRFTMIVQRRGFLQTERPASLSRSNPSVGPLPLDTAADMLLAAPYDDVAIGHESRFGSQLFTPDLITGFASVYDPQYFHLDAEAARDSHFGGLCASGWQTAAFWMKHYLAARNRSADARAAEGLPATIGGPSPGFSDMKWLRPVRVGETIHYGLRVTGKRFAGRAGWAIISTLNTGHLTDGALAFSFNGRLLWPTRADGPADRSG